MCCIGTLFCKTEGGAGADRCRHESVCPARPASAAAQRQDSTLLCREDSSRIQRSGELHSPVQQAYPRRTNSGNTRFCPCWRDWRRPGGDRRATRRHRVLSSIARQPSAPTHRNGRIRRACVVKGKIEWIFLNHNGVTNSFVDGSGDQPEFNSAKRQSTKLRPFHTLQKLTVNLRCFHYQWKR